MSAKFDPVLCAQLGDQLLELDDEMTPVPWGSPAQEDFPLAEVSMPGFDMVCPSRDGFGIANVRNMLRMIGQQLKASADFSRQMSSEDLDALEKICAHPGIDRVADDAQDINLYVIRLIWEVREWRRKSYLFTDARSGR